MQFDPDAFAHGPIESKIWLCDVLASLELQPVDNVYVLGAWSGTMAFLLYATSAVKFDKITNVDVDPAYLSQSRVVCNSIECQGKLISLLQDCNELSYPVGKTNLVINTSTDNILGNNWYNKIPAGTLVVLQGRTGGHRDCVQPYESLEDFYAAYPMSATAVFDEREFVYSDHSYTRFMKIGVK